MANDFTDQFPQNSVGNRYHDPTNALATERAQVLDFYHIPSGTAIAFKAFINNFSDAYSSEWNTESVYGRMDPIAAFQGTSRTLSVEWDVVSSSVMEAKLNMSKLQMLMSMLYPSYDAGAMGASSATTISTSPLFRFKFGNFAHDVEAGAGSSAARAEAAGLVGFIGGFTFEPDFEYGIVEGNPEEGEGTPPNLPASALRGGGQLTNPGEFFPLKFTLSMEFTVLHTHTLGWEKASSGTGLDPRTSGFPYDVGNSLMYSAGSESRETESGSDVEELEEAAEFDLGLG